MSLTSIGQVAPFPPLPGQPFPPARNHPRWKELYRLHDEWIMKYWPFKNGKKKARIPFMNLAGFSTWCAPASDFKRMVWGARIAGVFFLADDLMDSGKMLERIPGFKQAATGEGPLHVADRAEICHDIVFRAIKATSHPRTFAQLTKCTHEWWDSHVHEPYKNLDQYLTIRRVNIAMYFANAYFRYTLDINLSDAQVNHPLMREAEGIVADHVGLTNDLFSYAKEKMSNSDDTNIVRILQDHEGLTYAEAAEVIKNKIRQKELDFIPAGVAVLEDPELGQDAEVRRWIACLPYCMGGNLAWSQEVRFSLVLVG
ncbi:terpenoid synthase [Mycena galericulata]|nr:terpenoid synthase [Mycena galericulata]